MSQKVDLKYVKHNYNLYNKNIYYSNQNVHFKK